MVHSSHRFNRCSVNYVGIGPVVMTSSSTGMWRTTWCSVDQQLHNQQGNKRLLGGYKTKKTGIREKVMSVNIEFRLVFYYCLRERASSYWSFTPRHGASRTPFALVLYRLLVELELIHADEMTIGKSCLY